MFSMKPKMAIDKLFDPLRGLFKRGANRKDLNEHK